jgi:membrane associated rhomboid family serine protease
MNGYNGMRGFGKFSLFPPVIKSLLVINVSVFILQHLFLGIYKVGDFSLIGSFERYFFLIPLNFENASFYIWQLITYQFIHGDIWHIFFNLFALWMFGMELEGLWGSRKFLIFYLLCGIGAGLVQLFISPMFGPTAPTIGASGSIFGVLVAFGFTYPDRPIFMFPFFIPIPAKFFVMIYAGLALLLGFSGSGGGIAHFAHLGGALTGFLLLKFGDKIGVYKALNFIESKNKQTGQNYQSPYQQDSFSQPKVYRPNWQNKRQDSQKFEEPQNSGFYINGEEITQKKIDEILDKISETGYQNLSEREKRILFELSQKIK